jgi:hypothetical protein
MKAFLLIVLMLACQSAFSQQGTYFESSGAATEVPYWTAKSNPANGNTVILFFDGGGNLLYREELRGQLVKPTRRNIKKFDKMLLLMVENKLVAGHVDTVPFISGSGAYTLTSQRRYSDYQSLDSASVKTRVYTQTTGKLSIYIYNPRQNKILISLTSMDGKTIHEEATYTVKYGRDFDISRLKMGVYNLSLRSEQIDEKYTLQVEAPLFYSMNKLTGY